jgi:hypothetical protein
MCEVCAVFGLGRHWTDAGTLANPRLPAPDIARYRVERRRRIQLFNALLAGTGIVLSDWDGESFWVGRNDGSGERVADLGGVWPVAERLAGRPIDPLEVDFAPAQS